MHKVADWTSHHSVTTTDIQDILQAWDANSLLAKPVHFPAPDTDTPADARIAQRDYLETVVKPAMSAALPECDALDDIRLHPLAEGAEALPHTVYDVGVHHVDIYMDWSGTPDDAMCLAHEVGHAAHYLMSRSDQMPPVAREVCAFLGELLTLDYVLEQDRALFARLWSCFEREQQTYLGTDLEALQQALGTPDAAYTYRWNYPVARLAALEVHHNYTSVQTDLAALFKSGSGAMDFLPLERMAAHADDLLNYLPPFPDIQRAQSAGYQSLGAMALLDIDTYQGPSERSIGDVYAELLAHLQDQTAFIGLRADRRPIGYATWKSDPDTGDIALTHQSAPFGDHLDLHRTLAQRFGNAGRVTAQAPRSARQEQLAW